MIELDEYTFDVQRISWTNKAWISVNPRWNLSI